MTPYRKLGDDLDSIIGFFETDPAVAEWQRNVWRQEGKKKAITHDMLGSDHEKALAFEDGTKVGSLKKNSARRFWDYAGWHVFPPVEDVVRFSLFMHLDLYRHWRSVENRMGALFRPRGDGGGPRMGRTSPTSSLQGRACPDEALTRSNPGKTSTTSRGPCLPPRPGIGHPRAFS
jgi:hypothetical protein